VGSGASGSSRWTSTCRPLPGALTGDVVTTRNATLGIVSEHRSERQ
jgi:hypothetical protein